jgi:hypothetical protein
MRQASGRNLVFGDTVGYGPQPNECVSTIRARSSATLVGKPRPGCLAAISLANFNREARIANEWNGEQLTPEHRDFCLALSQSSALTIR